MKQQNVLLNNILVVESIKDMLRIGIMKNMRMNKRINNIIKIIGIDNFISEMEFWFDNDLLNDFVDSLEDEYSIK